MKSVEKCKRYSAFYPEKQELPHSLACVYWPVITSPRWRRVDTRAKGQQGVYVYMSMEMSTTIHEYHVTSLCLSAAIFVSESLAKRRSQHRQ